MRTSYTKHNMCMHLVGLKAKTLGLLALAVALASPNDSFSQVTFQSLYDQYDYTTGQSVVQNADGSYVFAVKSSVGLGSVKLVHLDPNGNIIWQKHFSPAGNTGVWVYSLDKTSDGGFVVGG